VRAAKGHEIDPGSLSYRAGDDCLAAARGRSNQQALFLDSTGRSYALGAHTLPSARGQGEPLTGRLAPPSGASFAAVLLGRPEQTVLVASDAGYGFVTTLDGLTSRHKSGKVLLSLPKGARVLPPLTVDDPAGALVAAVTTAGRLLVFPLAELPQLPRGKGNKIVQIPSARVAARSEFVAALATLPADGSLTLYCGKRHLTLKPADLQLYRGERGRRGNPLPRGFQSVDRAESR
ncbi:MAG TPA: DNA gyrase C-terminal beta-propeller domain-containing protein, partial [Gammaproteobacteria bacterium]